MPKNLFNESILDEFLKENEDNLSFMIGDLTHVHNNKHIDNFDKILKKSIMEEIKSEGYIDIKGWIEDYKFKKGL